MAYHPKNPQDTLLGKTDPPVKPFPVGGAFTKKLDDNTNHYGENGSSLPSSLPEGFTARATGLNIDAPGGDSVRAQVIREGVVAQEVHSQTRTVSDSPYPPAHGMKSRSKP